MSPRVAARAGGGAPWRVRRVALVLAALAIAGAAVTVRRSGVPPALANSVVAAPLVRLFNAIRLRVYFSHDAGCLEDLAAAGVEFVVVPDAKPKDECALRNVVWVRPRGLLRRPLYMTCRLALSLHRFTTDVLQPAAERHFGQPVVELGELGVRNCRTVEGYRSLLSEHAFANAIDIASFTLRDGTAIDVAADWGTASPRSVFLHEVAEGACAVFRTVLGPGFDEQHGDHLHFDMALFRSCTP